MNPSEIKAKVFEEVRLVPDNRLIELFNLIRAFRLQSKPVASQPENIMKFAGCWNDLPNEVYSDFLDDISLRRQQAFSQRQNRETSFD